MTTNHRVRGSATLVTAVAIGALLLSACGEGASVELADPPPATTAPTEEVTSEEPTEEVTSEEPTEEVTSEEPTEEVTSEEPTEEVTSEELTSDLRVLPSPEVGSCVIMAELEDASLFDFPTVPCDEEHDAEVIHTFDVDDPEFPGEDDLQDHAGAVCEPVFEAYIGSDFWSSSLDMYLFWPSSYTWNTFNDREIICIAYTMDGSMVTESFRDSGL